MVKFTVMCLMVYCIVLCAFIISNVLTGCLIPWLDKATEVLVNGAIVLLIAFVIFGVIACIYGIATYDPSFVGVMK